MVSAAFSFAHAWAILAEEVSLEFLLAILEVAICLTAINLPAIISFVFKIKDDTPTNENAERLKNLKTLQLTLPEHRRVSSLSSNSTKSRSLRGSCVLAKPQSVYDPAWLQSEMLAFDNLVQRSLIEWERQEVERRQRTKQGNYQGL
ncbi:hypothetical protein AAF712_008066 [Marasmius tenuissimus]|uniref:Uncharacterized protein n=1 Tax=Marasmius tenuissimus TaxID=585030 RepID=A0ABR2ZVX3_9AGAR